MEKVRFCLFFLYLSLFLSNLSAQTPIFMDSLAKNYDKNTILIQNNHFEKNGIFFSYGLFNTHLKKEMNRFVMSGHEYKRYENKKWLSIGSAVLGTVVILTSIKDYKINWTQYGIGAGFVLLSFPISSQSNNHFNRAIWLYNREAILRGRGE